MSRAPAADAGGPGGDMGPTITLSPLEVIAIRQWIRSYRQFHGADEVLDGLDGLDAKIVAAVEQPEPAIPRPPSCVTTGCKSRATTRGLCANCYAHYRRLIEVGKTTWEVLEGKGLALPVQARRGGA